MAIVIAGIFPSSDHTLHLIGLNDWDAIKEIPLSKRSGLSLVIVDIQAYRDLPPEKWDARFLSQALVNAIVLLIEIGEWEKALQLIHLPLQLEDNPTFFKQLATWGYFDIQLKILTKLNQLEIDQHEIKSFCLINLAKVYRDLERPKASEQCYQESITYFQKTEDFSKLGWQYHGLANLKLEEPDVDAANKYLHKAIELFSQLSPPDYGGIAQSYNDLARPARQYGNLDLASKYYYKAIEIYEKHPDLSPNFRIAWIYHGYSDFLCDIGQYAEAEKYGLKALEHFKDETYGTSWTYARLSKLYFYWGEYTTSKDYALRAKEMFEQFQHHRGLIILLHLISCLEIEAGNFEGAKETLEELMGTLCTRKDPFKNYLVIDGLYHLAIAYENFPLATLLMSQSEHLRINMEINLTPVETRAFQTHIDLCKSKLGTEYYQQLYEKGKMLGIEESIKLGQNPEEVDF